jgi:AcrR family transcriptional regulator
MKPSQSKLRRPGRPRNDTLQRKILKTALEQVFASGFCEVSVESIAAGAAVGKTTVYRRWPNKAAVIMDAFLMEVEPNTVFPPKARAIDSLYAQMLSQVKVFRGKYGILIRALIGEAQLDPDMREAFRERWIMPRRRKLKTVIEEAMRQGDFRKDIDLEYTMDMLYAPIYYRLLTGSGPISDSFVHGLLEQVRSGIGA